MEELEQDPEGAARLWQGFGADLSLGNAQSHFLMGFPSATGLWCSARGCGAVPGAAASQDRRPQGCRQCQQCPGCTVGCRVLPRDRCQGLSGLLQQPGPHGCHLTEPW